jgi:hypothetical protein
MKKMDKYEMAFSAAVPLTIMILTGLLGYYVVEFADSVLKTIA